MLWGPIDPRLPQQAAPATASTKLETWSSLGARPSKFRVSLVMKAGDDDGFVRLNPIPHPIRETLDVASARIIYDLAMR